MEICLHIPVISVCHKSKDPLCIRGNIFLVNSFSKKVGSFDLHSQGMSYSPQIKISSLVPSIFFYLTPLYAVSTDCREVHEQALVACDAIHHERRILLKQEVGRMVLFFTDQPSLLAPNIQVWYQISLS